MRTRIFDELRGPFDGGLDEGLFAGGLDEAFFGVGGGGGGIDGGRAEGNGGGCLEEGGLDDGIGGTPGSPPAFGAPVGVGRRCPPTSDQRMETSCGASSAPPGSAKKYW